MDDTKKVSDRHWQDFFIPEGVDPMKHVAETCPDVSEFDYVIGSDGSGHEDGCGAYAAVTKQVATDKCDFVFSANFGSTVQRNELQAFLHALHFVLGKEYNFRLDRDWGDSDHAKKVMPYINSYRPIRVLWYTDRQNIANGLLRDHLGNLVNRRSTEQDLWAGYRWLSQAFLITPYYVPRNEVELQALADSICTLGRDTIKMVKQLIKEQTWLTPAEKLSQKAQF